MKNWFGYTLKAYVFFLIFAFASVSHAKTNKDLAGYCGDGIVNGNEHCDGNALSVSSCKSLGGPIEGQIKCKTNCVLDISECFRSEIPVLTPALPVAIGYPQYSGLSPVAGPGFPPPPPFSVPQYPVCGNGIIEGDEQCDRDNVKSRRCTDYNGIYGEVGCTVDCKLDISRCITPEVDARIGGISEVCKCTCNNDNCSGGCTPIGDVGQGRVDCLFRCDNNCTCRCEGKTETHMEYSNIACQCDVDRQGNPQCYCNIDEMELLNVIVPNIGELSGRRARFPLSNTRNAQ